MSRVAHVLPEMDTFTLAGMSTTSSFLVGALAWVNLMVPEVTAMPSVAAVVALLATAQDLPDASTKPFSMIAAFTALAMAAVLMPAEASIS